MKETFSSPFEDGNPLRERWKKKDRVHADMMRYGSDALRSEMMQKAFKQTHHLRCTVGEHTYRVTRSSMKICYALQKLHIPVDMEAVVVGSLCHDLGILGRDEKYSSDHECYREHPKDSVTAARELYGDLPKKTEDIIRRHMWPLNGSRVPNSLEGLIVSAADKYSSVVDFLKGTEKKNKKNKKHKKEHK